MIKECASVVLELAYVVKGVRRPFSPTKIYLNKFFLICGVLAASVFKCEKIVSNFFSLSGGDRLRKNVQKR